MDAVYVVGGDICDEDREKFYISLQSIADKLALLSEKGIYL